MVIMMKFSYDVPFNTLAGPVEWAYPGESLVLWVAIGGQWNEKVDKQRDLKRNR